MTDKAISPLRRRMIEDMTIRKFAPKTQASYIRPSGTSPSSSAARRTRRARRTCARYQLHLASSGVAVPSQNATVTALRFFFTVTLGRGEVARSHAFRSRAAQAAGRSEPGGGRALPGSRAGPQVPGGAERGLWRGPARLRSDLAQGRRHRQRPHGHPGRAGQGAQGPLRHAVRASARAAARLVEGRRGRRAGCFPGRTRSTRSRRASSTAPAMPRRRRPGSTSASRCTRCGTASPPICSSRRSTSA